MELWPHPRAVPSQCSSQGQGTSVSDSPDEGTQTLSSNMQGRALGAFCTCVLARGRCRQGSGGGAGREPGQSDRKPPPSRDQCRSLEWPRAWPSGVLVVQTLLQTRSPSPAGGQRGWWCESSLPTALGLRRRRSLWCLSLPSTVTSSLPGEHFFPLAKILVSVPTPSLRQTRAMAEPGPCRECSKRN